VKTFESWWDLRSELTQVLGSSLIEMSDKATGYPADRTYEEWIGELKTHGEVLLTFGEADAKGTDPDVKEVQDSLKWVADNLLSLWD